jgi:hypothetical protein
MENKLIATINNNIDTIIALGGLYLILKLIYKIVKTTQRESINNHLNTLTTEMNHFNQILYANIEYLSQFDYMTVKHIDSSASQSSNSSTHSSDSESSFKSNTQQTDTEVTEMSEVSDTTDKKND